MGTKVNWGKLYEQERCKAIGVSFTKEEEDAINILKIPVKYVRLGILTTSDYETRLKKDSKLKETPLIDREKEELLMMAHEQGIPATSDATRETLVSLIEAKPSKVEKPKEKKKNVKKTK